MYLFFVSIYLQPPWGTLLFCIFFFVIIKSPAAVGELLFCTFFRSASMMTIELEDASHLISPLFSLNWYLTRTTCVLFQPLQVSAAAGAGETRLHETSRVHSILGEPNLTNRAGWCNDELHTCVPDMLLFWVDRQLHTFRDRERVCVVGCLCCRAKHNAGSCNETETL